MLTVDDDSNSLSDIVQPSKKVYMVNSKRTTLNDDFDKMEVKIKNIRELYQSLIKCTLQYFKESKPNENLLDKLDSKYKKSSFSILSQGFTKTGYGFGKDTTIGQVLMSLGETERELGDSSLEFEDKIKETWIKKLEQYIYVDINNANYIKRNLERHIQQYDNARSKLRKLQSKVPTEKVLKKMELEEEKANTAKIKFNRLALSCDYKYRMICNETQDAILVDIINFVRLQKKHYQECTSKLEAILRIITESHKSNRWDAIRDNKIGIQAYICKKYTAKNLDEVSVKIGQKVIIINQDTEIKDYWEIIVGGKNGLIPKECIIFETGVAVYDYESKNDDELSFQVGDEITILNKETGEYGWYQGFNKGSIGFFPSNYIKLIKIDYIQDDELSLDELEDIPFSRQESEYNISESQDENSSFEKSIASKKYSISNFTFPSKVYMRRYSDYMDRRNYVDGNHGEKGKDMKNTKPNNNNYNNKENKADLDVTRQTVSFSFDNEKPKVLNGSTSISNDKAKKEIPKGTVSIIKDNTANNNIEKISHSVSFSSDIDSKNQSSTQKKNEASTIDVEIKTLQTNIYSIIKGLNKNIEDVIVEEYITPDTANQSFDSISKSKSYNKQSGGPSLSTPRNKRSNLDLKKRQGVIVDEYDPLTAYASNVDEFDKYIDKVEKQSSPNGNIFDILEISEEDDFDKININNVKLSDVIDKKDIVDNKINIEIVLLRYIESFIDNTRILIEVKPMTVQYLTILQKSVASIKKISDATKILVFPIKSNETKVSLLMACKHVASSLASVVNYSKINRDIMYQQSQELIFNISHFIESINMNSGRYREEFWSSNSVKSQIEEDRNAIRSSLGILRDDSDGSLNDSDKDKSSIIEELIQNEFEILNSQVKGINNEDDYDEKTSISELLNIISKSNYSPLKKTNNDNKNKHSKLRNNIQIVQVTDINNGNNNNNNNNIDSMNNVNNTNNINNSNNIDKKSNNNIVNRNNSNASINRINSNASINRNNSNVSINRNNSNVSINRNNSNASINRNNSNASINCNISSKSSTPAPENTSFSKSSITVTSIEDSSKQSINSEKNIIPKHKRSASIKGDKKYRFNYKVISPRSEEYLKIRKPSVSPNGSEAEKSNSTSVSNSSSQLSSILRSYSTDNNNNNNSNDSNSNNNIKSKNSTNGNFQLESILTPSSQLSEEVNIHEEVQQVESVNKSDKNQNQNFLNNSYYLNYLNDMKNTDNFNDIKNLYKAIHIVNLVRKDIELILNNRNEYQIAYSKEELNKIDVLYQIITEISRTLKLAISRQQEVTDQILNNLDGNTSFSDEQEWNISIAKNGMELAEVVTKIHQYVYQILQNPNDKNPENNIVNDIIVSQKSDIKRPQHSTYGNPNKDYISNIREVEKKLENLKNNDLNSVNKSLNYYNSFNTDNINNLRFQSNINNVNNNNGNNSFGGSYSQKNNNMNTFIQSRNIPYQTSKISSIINPNDEIQHITTKYKSNNDMISNNGILLNKQSFTNPSHLVAQNKHVSYPAYVQSQAFNKPKIASINMNIINNNDHNNPKTNLSRVEEPLLRSNSTNHYYTLPYKSSNSSLKMNVNINNNNINNNRINNNNINNNNINNGNINNNNMINKNNNSNSYYQKGKSASRNDDSFTNLLNSLNEPIRNLVMSSEIKNDQVPSNVHKEILGQYKKVLNKNREFNDMIHPDSN